MPAHTSPCTLCKSQGSRRISSQLAEEYQKIVLSKERQKEIAALINARPACAIARMAIVYHDQGLADALMRRYGQSSDLLSSCEYRVGSQNENITSTPLLHELVRAVHSYVSRSLSAAQSPKVSRVDHNSMESVFGVSPLKYDYDTSQSRLLEKLSSSEQPTLNILSAKSVWALEQAQRSRKQQRA